MQKIALFGLALLLAVSAMPVDAADYYVSPAGSDGNPGTLSQPWATPGYGSRQLQPGDTLIILGGRYIIQDAVALTDVISPASGAPGAWITIKGETGQRPVLAGRNNTMAAVDLNNGKSYIRLENLEITHDDTVPAPQLYFRTGVTIAGAPSSHIVLQDLYIHHLDDAALNIQEVDYLEVLNCRFEYCAVGGIISPDRIINGNRHLIIRGCRLAYMGRYYQGGPLSPADRPDGLGLEESEGPLEIADTVVEYNLGDGLDSKMNNTYIHHCVVANNAANGVKLWGDHSKAENCLVYANDDPTVPWSPFYIWVPEFANYSFELVNVTIVDNPARDGAVPLAVQINVTDPALNLVLRNCIIANGRNWAVDIGPNVNLTAQNNLFYRPGAPEQVWANGRVYTAAEIEAGDLGPGNISRAPQFVRPLLGTTGDYRLAPGSPGIDQGAATLAPLVDLEYRKRPLGKTFDMGAYEFSPGKTGPAMFSVLLE
jgi:hypothetical protein